MKSTWSGVVAAVGVVILLASVTVGAHHAFTAEFDAGKPISVTGIVTVVAWTNPHAHIHIDVPDKDGKVTSWDFELGSPNMLMRRGWTRTALKVGDKITAGGYLAKDGSHFANARAVVLSDGRTVFAGSSLDDGAPK